MSEFRKFNPDGPNNRNNPKEDENNEYKEIIKKMGEGTATDADRERLMQIAGSGEGGIRKEQKEEETEKLGNKEIEKLEGKEGGDNKEGKRGGLPNGEKISPMHDNILQIEDTRQKRPPTNEEIENLGELAEKFDFSLKESDFKSARRLLDGHRTENLALQEIMCGMRKKLESTEVKYAERVIQEFEDGLEIKSGDPYQRIAAFKKFMAGEEIAKIADEELKRNIISEGNEKLQELRSNAFNLIEVSKRRLESKEINDQQYLEILEAHQRLSESANDDKISQRIDNELEDLRRKMQEKQATDMPKKEYENGQAGGKIEGGNVNKENLNTEEDLKDLKNLEDSWEAGEIRGNVYYTKLTDKLYDKTTAKDVVKIVEDKLAVLRQRAENITPEINKELNVVLGGDFEGETKEVLSGIFARVKEIKEKFEIKFYGFNNALLQINSAIGDFYNSEEFRQFKESIDEKRGNNSIEQLPKESGVEEIESGINSLLEEGKIREARELLQKFEEQCEAQAGGCGFGERETITEMGGLIAAEELQWNVGNKILGKSWDDARGLVAAFHDSPFGESHKDLTDMLEERIGVVEAANRVVDAKYETNVHKINALVGFLKSEQFLRIKNENNKGEAERIIKKELKWMTDIISEGFKKNDDVKMLKTAKVFFTEVELDDIVQVIDQRLGELGVTDLGGESAEARKEKTLREIKRIEQETGSYVDEMTELTTLLHGLDEDIRQEMEGVIKERLSVCERGVLLHISKIDNIDKAKFWCNSMEDAVARESIIGADRILQAAKEKLEELNTELEATNKLLNIMRGGTEAAEGSQELGTKEEEEGTSAFGGARGSTAANELLRHNRGDVEGGAEESVEKGQEERYLEQAATIIEEAEKVENLSGFQSPIDAKIFKIKEYFKSEEYKNINDTMLSLHIQARVNNRLKELREKLLEDVEGNMRILKDYWETGKCTGRDYYDELIKIWNHYFKTIDEKDAAEMVEKELIALKERSKNIGQYEVGIELVQAGGDTEKERKIIEKLKEKYNHHSGAEEQINSAVADFYLRRDGGEGKEGKEGKEGEETYYDKKFAELEERKAAFEAMEEGEEKERSRKEYLEELQNLKENYKDFCYAEIGKGKSLDEIKPKYGVENEMKDEMKFMDPEKVKEVFGKQLEAIMSEKKFDPEHNEKDKKEINAVLNMGQVLGFGKEKSIWDNLTYRKPRKKILDDLDKIKEDAEKLVKRELYFESLHKEKAKGEEKKGLLNKPKELLKWASKFSGGMAQTIVTFKAAEMGVQWLANMPSVASALGASASSPLAIGVSSFMAAGAGLYAGRGALKFATESWRNRGYGKQDISSPEAQERVKDTMANLMSLSQMERFEEKANPDLAKDKKNFTKQKEQYIKGEMKNEDWEKILDKRTDEKYHKKYWEVNDASRGKKDKKSDNMRKFLKETGCSPEEAHQKFSSMILLEKKASEREADVAKKIYEAVKDNPDLAKKFEKGGFLEGAGKVGKAYLKELGTLAAFEVPILRPILMASGGGQEGKEFVKILFEGTKLYEDNPKMRKIIETLGWTAGAVGMSFAFAPNARAGERNSTKTAGDFFGPAKAYAENAGGKNARNKTGEGGNWVAGKFEGMKQEIKEDLNMVKSLKEGKFFENWLNAFKARHGADKGEKKAEKGKTGEMVKKDETMSRRKEVSETEIMDRYSEALGKINSSEREFDILVNKINKLDGKYEHSIKDMQKAVVKNLKTGKWEIRQDLRDSAHTEFIKGTGGKAETPSAVKQETAPAKTEAPSAAKTEAVKPAQETPTAKAETKVQPSAPVADRMTVEVKKGDTVWGIAEQVGKELGIDTRTKGNLSPEERAKNIFKRDTIKDDIVMQMKAAGKNPELIKKGERMEIDMAELKARFEGMGIAAKAENLSKKDISNILDHNKGAVKKEITSRKAENVKIKAETSNAEKLRNAKKKDLAEAQDLADAEKLTAQIKREAQVKTKSENNEHKGSEKVNIPESSVQEIKAKIEKYDETLSFNEFKKVNPKADKQGYDSVVNFFKERNKIHETVGGILGEKGKNVLRTPAQIKVASDLEKRGYIDPSRAIDKGKIINSLDATGRLGIMSKDFNLEQQKRFARIMVSPENLTNAKDFIGKLNFFPDKLLKNAQIKVAVKGKRVKFNNVPFENGEKVNLVFDGEKGNFYAKKYLWNKKFTDIRKLKNYLIESSK